MSSVKHFHNVLCLSEAKGMDIIMPIVGENIKRIRNERGFTQKELSKKIGTTQQNLAQYENGKRNPKIETIYKIADALEVDISELLEYKTIIRNNQVFSGSPHSVEVFNKIADIADGKSDLLKQTIELNINLLNPKGQAMAARYVEDLTKIPEYCKEQSDIPTE